MYNDYRALHTCPLFKDMTVSEVQALAACLSPALRRAGRGEAVLTAGEHTAFIGIVAEGIFEGVRTGHTGNRELLATFRPGDVYAEILALSQGIASPVDVIAKQPGAVLLIGYEKLTAPCVLACSGHIKLIQNTLRLIGKQYFALHQKVAYLSKKTIRARISAYLLDNLKDGETMVHVPLSRTEMAQYLSADRSALSRELARMQKGGLITYHQDIFTLTDISGLKEQSE